MLEGNLLETQLTSFARPPLSLERVCNQRSDLVPISPDYQVGLPVQKLVQEVNIAKPTGPAF